MTFRRMLLVIGIFLGFNLLGPSGILHWLNLKNEGFRIQKQILTFQNQIKADKKELERFELSQTVQKRTVRNELGYLLEDEISVEFSR